MIIKCGIYTIENKLNKKRYYGSTNNWQKRKNLHRSQLRKGIHGNFHLQAAWNKYGENAFEFIWIEDVQPDKLMSVEQGYLDANTGGYNIGLVAGNGMRGRCHSNETKTKISASLRNPALKEKLSFWKGKVPSEMHRSKISASMKNISKSDEHRKNISNGRKGIQFSESHLQHLSESHRRADAKGYYFQPDQKTYRVRVSHYGKQYSGGCYKTEKEAVDAVQKLRTKLREHIV